jgi:hypothetical protein
MAKKMYARQLAVGDSAKDGSEQAAGASQPNQYTNLQDAAYKQAQARLAKLHDEYQQSRDYQEYYGNETAVPRHRFSVSNKLRRRASDSDDELDDRKQSEKIREQMSMFSSKLTQVDKDKRNKDREALLAAAQRNVKAQLHGMDEKVYQETGRANPSLITDWEAKAQKAAQNRHESRTEHKGKIDIGGGMFMTQEEIDAIASKRIKPVLDDINDKAETERERQEVLKMEEQARREQAEKEKVRDREAKEISKKTRGTERLSKSSVVPPCSISANISSSQTKTSRMKRLRSIRRKWMKRHERKKKRPRERKKRLPRPNKSARQRRSDADQNMERPLLFPPLHTRIPQYKRPQSLLGRQLRVKRPRSLS